MALAGFEPTISAGEQPQTYALDRAAPGTGNEYMYTLQSFLGQLAMSLQTTLTIFYIHIYVHDREFVQCQ